ncbi:MAG: APC family permease [Gammaproteobacteria bacterium]|jgi:amino acid transporter
MIKKVKRVLFGPPRNPMHRDTRRHISLIAFFAWVGLGADGLSSIAYGPEQAFIALGHHAYLALFLAIMIAITVFVISLAYNQVIELFPSGGGGYKVATRLIGPYAGLVSGTALILGYVLTMAVSIASGVDALFSFLPQYFQEYKLLTELCLLLFMMYLNLRGMKESIKIFLPIFLGFVVTHVAIILYGISIHADHFHLVVHNAWAETSKVSASVGWFMIVALLLRAYSIGGGTYTGLEAVSNNVNNLAEPRVRTGKWTMLYMAISLSFTAAGILLLYLLFSAQPVVGKTLNAVVFGSILQSIPYGHAWVILLLLLEAGLLFIGANTGFLGGPSVLANMAIDSWVPHRFRHLSSRLVVQNGIVLFTVLSVLILLWTSGNVTKLVILYSTSVFLTFTMSLFGLTRYWWKGRKRKAKKWPFRLFLSVVGLIVCLFILVTVIIAKFTQGGWLTIVINGTVITLCILIRRHYKSIKKLILKLDRTFTFSVSPVEDFKLSIDPDQPTAVFFVGTSIGETMHTLLWAQRMFPNHFKNFIFISVGVVNVDTYESDKALKSMQKKVNRRLQYFVNYAEQNGIPAKAYCDYGTDHIAKLANIAQQVKQEFKEPIFFAARMVLKHENWLTRLLHNETPVSLQRSLHMQGMQMIILPVMLNN